MRIFCAIELPHEIKKRVAAHIAMLARISHAASSARWERTEKQHITLKFFGEVATARVEELSAALARTSKKFAAFEAQIAGTGAFPPGGMPRVLWLGVADRTGLLADLQRTLEKECAACGFPAERRPFRPHLTLARTSRMNRAEAQSLARAHLAANFEAVSFSVSELVLMHSELSPQGSRYTPLAHHKLNDEVGMMNDE